MTTNYETELAIENKLQADEIKRLQQELGECRVGHEVLGVVDLTRRTMMGYSTNFNGELKFTREATALQLAALNAMLGEDCRDHPEWNALGLYAIDLELNNQFDGLRWDGSEKTYDLDKLVNVVLRVMREKWPDFGLTGQLQAQGKEFGDRWALVIGTDGWAAKVKYAPSGKTVRCPHCAETFSLEDAQVA